MATAEKRFITYEEARDIFATKADLAEMETRLVKWMVGVVFGGIVAATTIGSLIVRLLG